jgi:hypothetical protein
MEVQGAPDFLFAATMNPGGDFGKRELSPALRNRFTEVGARHGSVARRHGRVAVLSLAKTRICLGTQLQCPSESPPPSLNMTAFFMHVCCGACLHPWQVWVPHITDASDLRMLIGEKLAAAALRVALPAPSLRDAFTGPMLAFVQWFEECASSGSVRKPAQATVPAPGAGAGSSAEVRVGWSSFWIAPWCGVRCCAVLSSVIHPCAAEFPSNNSNLATTATT